MNRKNERLRQLMEVLRVRGFVPIRELAQAMGVSEMTIRRDLKVLEQSRMAENIYGTSVYNAAGDAARDEDAPQSCELLEQVRVRDAQKERIGRRAAALVEAGDTVILDTGTTTERIVGRLPQGRDVTALCFNMNILMELRRRAGVRMVLAGGYYHPNTQMFESAQGVDFIRSIRAQKAFVSAAGIHERLGVTCMNSYEAPTKRAVIASSLRKILVADSSKFGKVCPAYFCALEEIDTVVTDEGLPQEWRERLERSGVELLLAD